MFQSTVLYDIAAGVVGELAFEGPLNAQPLILNSTDAANNVFGRAFTHPASSEGQAQAGGTGFFAGILANPKEHVGAGTSAGGTLAATMTLRNGEVASFVQETPGIFVSLPSAAEIGDHVIYNNTTGALDSVAFDAPAPDGWTRVPTGVVVRYRITAGGGGLAVMAMTGPVAVPSAVTSTVET